MKYEKKSSFWQVVRALCILAVILIHCPNGTSLDQRTIQFWFYIFIRNIINFPVAIFIFMAGMFVNKHKLLNEHKTYIFSRCVGRLLLPYLIWSAFYLLISYFKGDIETILTVFKRLLVGKAAGPFYYIIVMLQLVLITYWLYKTHDVRAKALVGALTPIMLVVIYYLAIVKGAVPWWCDTLFPVWIGFYFFGIQIQKEDKMAESILRVIGSPYFVIIAFIINLLESVLLVKAGITFKLSISQNRFGGFLYALALIGAFYRNKEIKTSSKIMMKIGDDSYGIFYIHCIFIMIFNNVLTHFLGLEQWLLRFISVFILTLICSEVVINLYRVIAKRLHLEQYIKLIGF